MEILSKIATHTWAMIAEMGVYLILGLAISVLLHRFLRQAWVERLMGKRKLSSVIWGSVVGVPMPLCSCGVIPVTMSLRSKGASRGATVSFLTSTPQTGVDSFLATYGMLGPVFAVYKIIVAFLSGILVGLATDLFVKDLPSPAPQTSIPKPAPIAQQPNLKESFRYGFYTMPGDLASALILGFVLAGLISALAPADLLSNIPGGALAAILLATLISVPFYICSTGSIPLALALVHSGLPISAALVLLIAGPATNIATITTMRKVLGGRSAFIYVGGVILTTWLAAAVYHFFLDTGTLGTHAMSHEMDLPLWKHLGGALLLLLLVFPHLHQKLRSPQTVPSCCDGDCHSSETTDSTMSTLTLSIQGMNCSHCENSVRDGLNSLPGIAVQSVDKNSSTATVQSESFDEAAVREKIASLGFDYQGTK
ncbi:permease [Pelagicoccus sp. SDUM812005]|uniref:permease n=1 Tax=Pelagicoccus sp. SDUM812005 TaxID=3041257 RepID=UPI00280C4C7F|nr:permease [Pelagicoccus sp. SDUM812005]MDQ8182421.1 permease [Pelagicoccus sp. SDUM812005]